MSEQTDVVRPTRDTYEQLQQAYEYLNKALFEGVLPNCLITLQRRRRTYGYFSPDRFTRDDGLLTDEIALNPSHFRDRTVIEVLGTLAHEMVHLWQHHHGKPGRGRYHNREWAARMKAIGLQPTDTGEDGGKETGERMHHLVVDGGALQKAAQKLVARNYGLPWSEYVLPAPPSAEGAEGGQPEDEGKSGKRVKYVCPSCDLNAWAKQEAKLVCGTDMTPMAPAQP